MHIHHLRLQSKNLLAQKAFYVERLGFQLLTESETHFQIQAGQTILEFQQHPAHNYYHFAFLIPTPSIQESITFLAQKDIPILPHKGEEILDFGNGLATYFYDADGNIAEFIERPSEQEDFAPPFSAQSIVCVNEIGLPVDLPLQTSALLIKEAGVRPLNPDGMKESFCWVGDFRGVVIVVKRERLWLPVDDKPAVRNDFEVLFSDGGEKKWLRIEDGNIVVQE
ncbi:MAG: VOC family protein [Bacteroidota bacterium]